MANCALPENAVADITTGASSPMIAVAIAPNAAPSKRPLSATGAISRAPIQNSLPPLGFTPVAVPWPCYR